MTPKAIKYLTVIIILPQQQGLSNSHTCPLVIHTNKREQLKQTNHSALHKCHSSNSSRASGLALNFTDNHLFFDNKYRCRKLATCLVAIKCESVDISMTNTGY
jgi:hypothetical protein